MRKLKKLIKDDKKIYKFNKSIVPLGSEEKSYTKTTEFKELAVKAGQSISDKKSNIFRPKRLGPKKKKVSYMFGQV